MSNPTSNYGWQMPTATDLVTDLPADFEVFGQAVDTALMDLKGGTTGQVLAKASNTDMDFVWSADAAGMTNPMTTTGDIIYSSSGSTPARLGIGTTGQVLNVAGGIPAWATAASGGMTLISTTSLTGASTTISSIPTTYKNLQIVMRDVKDTLLGTRFRIQFNGNTGTVYHGVIMYQTVTAPTAAALGDYYNSGARLNWAFAADSNTDCFFAIDITDYASSTSHKLFTIQSGYTYSSNPAIEFASYRFLSDTAITSIKIEDVSGVSMSGSLLLYGVS